MYFIAYRIVDARGRSPDFSPSSYRHHHPTISLANPNTPSAVDLGTTLVAIKYSGGVVVGADTRTSVGGYVSNKLAYKMNIILSTTNTVQEDEPAVGFSSSKGSTTSCVVCRSGSAADTQWITTKARHTFLTRQLERPYYIPSISHIAHYIRHCLRDSPSEEPLQASLICVGYDGKAKIFCITPGGSLWEEDSFCVSGSGSNFLLGYLDSIEQKSSLSSSSSSSSSNLLVTNKEEAVALVTKLLQLSIARDSNSGGLVRIMVVNEDGMEELTFHSTSRYHSNNGGHRDLKGFSNPSWPLRSN
jgi:20S proteasome subunit beta 1